MASPILRAALVGVAVASLLAVAVPDEQPVASACGFNSDILDVGTVHVYLACTQPRVDVDLNEEPHPPEDP